MRSYPKQPADQIDIDIDFSTWFPATDTITTLVAESVQITGETESTPLVIASVQYDGITGKVWVNAGADGCDYRVTTTAASSGGRVKEIEFRVRVKDIK